VIKLAQNEPIVQAFLGEAISSGSFVFVMIGATADSCKLPTAATDLPLGVRLAPVITALDSCDVVLFGLTHILLGATVTQGAHIQINGTSGKAKALGATGYDAGTCLEGGDADEIVKCLINICDIVHA